MAKQKNKNPALEVHIRIDDLALTVAPGQQSAGFDELLERNGANSFVFIPLAKLTGKKHRKNARASALARKKKLPDGTWFDGELRNADDGETVPGVLGLSLIHI